MTYANVYATGSDAFEAFNEDLSEMYARESAEILGFEIATEGEHVENLKNKLSALKKDIPAKVSEMFNSAKERLAGLIGKALGKAGELGKAIAGFFSTVWKRLGAAFGVIKTACGDVLNALKGGAATESFLDFGDFDIAMEAIEGGAGMSPTSEAKLAERTQKINAARAAMQEKGEEIVEKTVAAAAKSAPKLTASEQENLAKRKAMMAARKDAEAAFNSEDSKRAERKADAEAAFGNGGEKGANKEFLEYQKRNGVIGANKAMATVETEAKGVVNGLGKVIDGAAKAGGSVVGAVVAFISAVLGLLGKIITAPFKAIGSATKAKAANESFFGYDYEGCELF